MLELYIQEQIHKATSSKGALQTCLSEELVRVFDLVEKYVDPTANRSVFEALDDELARRVGEDSLTNA